MSGARHSGSIILGIARLARFNSLGFAEFTATRQGFLNSLTPLVALAMALALFVWIGAGPRIALVVLLTGVVGQLAPAVISELLAAYWQRQSLWLRFAVAFNWCQFAGVLVINIVPGVVTKLMFPNEDAMRIALSCGGAIAGYWFVWCMFLARRGLHLSVLRSLVFVVLVHVGTLALVVGPSIVDRPNNALALLKASFG